MDLFYYSNLPSPCSTSCLDVYQKKYHMSLCTTHALDMYVDTFMLTPYEGYTLCMSNFSTLYWLKGAHSALECNNVLKGEWTNYPQNIPTSHLVCHVLPYELGLYSWWMIVAIISKDISISVLEMNNITEETIQRCKKILLLRLALILFTNFPKQFPLLPRREHI